MGDPDDPYETILLYGARWDVALNLRQFSFGIEWDDKYVFITIGPLNLLVGGGR